MSTPTYDNFRTVRRFGSLDALRCISIIVVIFSHVAGDDLPLVETQLVGLGGVRLFFAISGFLITTLLLRERDATGGISLRNFVVRRTLRIFPLYYTVLLAYVALVCLTARHDEVGVQFLRNLPGFLTYTTNLFVSGKPAAGADRVLFYFAWSLATEEQFYLIWPAIEKLAGELRAGIVMVCVVMLLIAYRAASAGGLLQNARWAHGFTGVFVESISLSICLGVLIAHALHSPRGFRLLARIWTPFNSLIGLVILTILVIASRSEMLKSLASAFVVLSCVQSERHVLSGLFKSRPLVLVGRVSYGMYLTHLLCNHAIKIFASHVHIFELGAGVWLEFIATTVTSFGVALLSFRYYESIFLRLKNRFEPKPTAGLPPQAPQKQSATAMMVD